MSFDGPARPVGVQKREKHRRFRVELYHHGPVARWGRQERRKRRESTAEPTGGGGGAPRRARGIEARCGCADAGVAARAGWRQAEHEPRDPPGAHQSETVSRKEAPPRSPAPTLIVPPWASAIPRAMAKPSPAPPAARPREPCL